MKSFELRKKGARYSVKVQTKKKVCKSPTIVIYRPHFFSDRDCSISSKFNVWKIVVTVDHFMELVRTIGTSIKNFY